MIEELFAEIDELHFPEFCVDPSEIERFEKQLGKELPEDLKSFYRHYKSVKLFGQEGFSVIYRFVPISEIHPTRYDIFDDKSADLSRLDSWLTICDVQDGNYIAIDVNSNNGQEYNFIDCFHESFGEPGGCTVIAKSFTELLARALHSGSDTIFWGNEFLGYGDALPLTPENAIERIELPNVPKRWHVRFTRNGINFHQTFDDDDFGGKEFAYDAAKEYVKENSL